VDISAARNVRWKRPALVGAADSRRRCRALAAPRRSYGPIDERDIAAVAVRVLCEDGHSGAEYVLTGPQSLSQFEQVSTIGQPAFVTSTVAEITGTPARTFLDWATDHAAEFRA